MGNKYSTKSNSELNKMSNHKPTLSDCDTKFEKSELKQKKIDYYEAKKELEKRKNIGIKIVKTSENKHKSRSISRTRRYKRKIDRW